MSVMYEAKWTDALKAAYATSHPENCAGPDGSFPIKDASDVPDAWDLAGHAADPDAVRAKIKAIAKRLGFTSALPDTAKQESAATVTSSLERPRQKIATLKVCFLEYNARSLNGRIYPKATCDAIYRSLQQKLADSNALPMTCFVSHEAANGNANTELVGRVAGGSQEGSKFYALIDLADTRVARDQLALVEGGYMRSESMRVLGVELKYDRDYDLPLVVAQEGAVPELMGIDLTTRPGLQDTARILQTLYESQSQQPYIEGFALTDDVHIEQEKDMPIPIYLKVLAGAMQEALTEDRKAHQRIHDHLAGVLDATVGAKHGEESARLRALVEAELSEEGRAIAQKHAVKLAAAHDESAKQCGMECVGCYNDMLGIDGADDQPQDQPTDSDGDHDGDESVRQSSTTTTKKGEDKPMTPKEMMEALKAQGYTIAPPKTAEEEIAALKSRLEEQDRKLAALSESRTSEQAPQRQTQVQSEFSEGGLAREDIYEEGDYLKGDLKPQNWKSLADRRVPWPKEIDPELALHELAPFLTARLLEQEAAAQGRSLDQFIAPYEQV